MWTAALAGGLSLLSGLGARQSAKKQAKTQAANDYIANATNAQNIKRANVANKNIALKLKKELLKIPEVTTEHTIGGVYRSAGREGDSTTISNAHNYSYVDTDGMMAAAERAGFNPVTFLNAGGMQAYTQTGTNGFSNTHEWETSYDNQWTDETTTTTRTGHNAAAAITMAAGLMSPQVHQMTSSQAQNIPSVASAVGDAGTAALNAYRTDAARADNQAFQRELLNLQLDAIAKGQKANRSFSATPTMVTSGGTTIPSAAGLSANPVKSPFEANKAQFTNPWANGTVDPRMADAQSMEDRYAEGVSIPYGLWQGINDGVLNLTGKSANSFVADSYDAWRRLFNGTYNAPLQLRLQPGKP